MLEEIADVLSRPYFRDRAGWTEEKIFEYVDQLRQGSHIVPGTTSVSVSPDPKDNMLFACAVEAQADYILSYDKKHVLSVGEYQGVRTIHPTDFVSDVLDLRKAA
jgi:putative PIN family toxin of toxin-antitoxin system